MREVTGPVIGVALVLAAVFIPTAFLPGITGRLYQQFAVTIAISVILSAFNALTLSPALSALLLRPRKKTRGPLGWFFGGSKGLCSVTNGYVNLSRIAIRKAVMSFVLLAVLAGAPDGSGRGYRAASCRKRTRATFTWRYNCPTPLRLNGPMRPLTKSRSCSARHQASNTRRAIIGFNL